MSIKFKSKDEILGIVSSAKEGRDIAIAQTGVFEDENLLQKPLGEIIDSGESPRKIVEKVEKWCPLYNAQTIIGHKKISKIRNKPFFFPVFKILAEKKPKKFVIKDLIKWLEAEKFTEGDAQRKVLASLVCMGFIKKIRENYKKKEGDKLKVKDYFCWNENPIPCKNYKDDACSLNWEDAEETDFYTNQYLQSSEEE